MARQVGSRAVVNDGPRELGVVMMLCQEGDDALGTCRKVPLPY